MIKIFDSTLRDGSHALRHQLTRKMISSYAKKAEAAGVYTMYVGHGNGNGASSIQLDKSLLTDRQMIEAARPYLKKTKLGVFILPGFGTIKDDLEPYIAMIDVIQVGCHCSEVTVTRQHIEYAVSKGKEVYVALMMSHMLEAKGLIEQAKIAQGYGATGIFLMDSAGACLPDEVYEKVGLLCYRQKLPIGYHPHNNLGLAVSNALSAIKSGATMIDGTTRGFGAGAGNVPLEILAGICDTEVDFYKMLDAADLVSTFAPPVEISSLSIISGLSGVFSGFAPLVKRAAKKYKVDPRDIFIELGKRKVVAGQEDLIIEVAGELHDKGKANN